MKWQLSGMSRRMTWAVALFSATTFGLVSCSTDGDPVVQPDASVKVIHTIPGTGSVDLPVMRCITNNVV